MIPQLKLLPDGRYYEELHARLTAARRRVYVSMFLFSPRWYDKTVNLLADFTAASQRGLQCRIVMSAAPIKIGKRRPNQETAQRLLNAGWQVRVMTGNRTLHEKLILIDYQTVIFGSHNLAWSSISSNCELSVCIDDENLSRQAAAPRNPLAFRQGGSGTAPGSFQGFTTGVRISSKWRVLRVARVALRAS